MRVEPLVLETSVVALVIPETEEEKRYMQKYIPSLIRPEGYPFSPASGIEVPGDFQKYMERRKDETL